MHKIIIAILLLSPFAYAQRPTATPSAKSTESPKIDIFAGYSYLHRFDSRHGWNASATWTFYRCFGVTADFSGHYRSDSGTAAFPSIGTFTFDTSEHLHSFTFGPTATFRNRTRFTPFAHYLLGVLRVTDSFSSMPISPPPTGTFLAGSSSGSYNAFNEYFGGGVDIGVSNRFAVRAGQFDLQYVRMPGGFWERHFRYSGGIVIRLGKK